MDLIPWTSVLYVIYRLFYKSCDTLFFTSLILLNPVAANCLEKLEKNLGQGSPN